MIKNKKILITGATGFIGANLVRYSLQKKAKVFIFTRKNSDKWRIKEVLKNVQEYRVDLFNQSKVLKTVLEIDPDIVFHTAIYGGYGFQNNPFKIAETNFIGTVNLVEACSQIKLELFINTGSSSEYGIKSKPMRESDFLEPITEYGATKAAATLYTQAKAKKGTLPATTLRLFSPYGYYEEKTRLVPTTVLLCLKGKSPTIYSRTFVRDFAFVEDIVKAYFQAVRHKEKAIGEIFNISAGCQYSIDEVVEIVIKLTGEKVKPIYRLKGDHSLEPKVWQANIAKAKKFLKWQPKHDLNQGLAKTVKWFKKNPDLYEKN